jgi:drug/metabolite transporter (DMT)-like permease
MSTNPTLAVLFSELVLSLYPILVKTVNTNIFTQILARFFIFPGLALVFGSAYDFSAVWGNPREAIVGILHNLLNLGHIATSYTSYQNLPVGSAVALFYLYPIFNILAGVLLFGESISIFSVFLIIIAFIGVYLITTSYESKTADDKTKKHEYGVIMGILAAITETMIFIFVKSSKDAKLSPYYTINHLYPAGLAMLLTYAIFNKNIIDMNSINWIKLIGFNAILGFTGYVARFYAIPKISTIVFSLLSFLGVAFGYTWGLVFMGDTPTLRAIFGGGLIAFAAAILRYFGSV